MLLLHKHIQLFVFLVKEFIQAIEDLGKSSAALKKLHFSPNDSGKARGQHLPRLDLLEFIKRAKYAGAQMIRRT